MSTTRVAVVRLLSAVVLAMGLLVLASPTTTQAAGAVLVGDQKIESGSDSDTAGMAEAFRTSATASGAVATISVYVATGSASAKLSVGLYSSNSTNTHPATLLAQGTLAAPAKGAWDTVTLTSQAAVTAGVSYWITILSPAGSGTVAFRDVLGGGVSETSSQTTLVALPAAWTTGTTYKDGPISAYGASAATIDTTPPSAPSGLVVGSQGTTSFSLSWVPSTDDVGVVGYDVFNGATSLGQTSGTTFAYTSLACGTAYVVGVDAYDAAGNRSPETTTTASTAACPDTTAPTTPSGLVQTGATNTSVALAWSPSTDEFGVAGYDVYADGVRQSVTVSTSATIGGLVCGTSHSIAVDAFDAAGNVSARTSLTMSTATCPPDTTPPSAPGDLVVAGATPTSVTVSWSASADDVGVAGYELFVGGVDAGSTSGTTATLTGLACGGVYAVGVDAFDAAGNVSPTTTISASTAPCPDVTPPSVSLDAPSGGASISGVATLSATASDNVGVAGVRFTLDGATIGSEVTSPPYELSWDSRSTTNGSHTLAAVARDAAGNVTTSAVVTITVANTLVQPVPVPAASVNGVTVGPGFVDSSDHQLLRTVAGSVYIVAADDDPCQVGGSGVIRVWKGVGSQPTDPAVPTSFVEMDAADHPISGGSSVCQYTGGSNSVLFSPDSRLDPNGTIHMVYIDMYSRNLYYQTFSAVTDTWGARSVIATFASKNSGFSWPRGGQASLTLDSNNVPHVVYATYGTSNQLDYTDKVFGAWSTPVTIYSGTNEMNPSLTTALDGSLHLTWLDNADATNPVVKYARYANGSWSPVETVSAGDGNTLSDSNGDASPAVATDAGGRPFVVFLDGTVNGSNDDVRIRYRTAANTWVDDSPPGAAGGQPSATGTLFAHTPTIYISRSGTVWIFLGHDALISPGGYAYQAGGPNAAWSAYATIDPRNKLNTTAGYAGLDGSASLRYDPLRDNAPNIIDLLYYDENDGTTGYAHHATLYYKAVDIP